VLLQNVSKCLQGGKKSRDACVSKTKWSRAKTFPERSRYIEIGAAPSHVSGDAIVVF
jgi:hypothetical protein